MLSQSLRLSKKSSESWAFSHFHRKATTGYAGGTKKFYLWIEKEDLR